MNTHPRPLLWIVLCGAGALASLAPAHAAADYSTSTKCFDTGPSPCTTFALKDPPDPVRYAIRFVNSGRESALKVHFRDNLNNLGSACGGALDFDPLRAPSCIADPATCGGVACLDAKITGGIFTADIDEMIPGCSVDIVIDNLVRSGSAGTCCNEAEVTWNDSVGKQTVATNQACFNAGLPELVIRKELDPPGQTPHPGDTVTFRITVTNNNPTGILTEGLVVDTADSCMRIADCAAIACDPPGNCGACTLTATGFTYSIQNLGPKDEVSFLVTATIDPGLSGTTICKNKVETSDPDPFVEESTVIVTVSPRFTVTKAATPAVVVPGGTSHYLIEVDNRAGTIPLTGCRLTDDVKARACMSLASCAVLTVPAVGYSCDLLASTVATDPFDVPAGAVQQVYVPVRAGSVETACENTASVTCDGGTQSASGTLEITGSAPSCPLFRGEATFWPLLPAKGGTWLYSAPCVGAPGTSLPELVLVSIVSGELPDAFTGLAGTLTLYQAACSATCPARIGLVKGRASGRVALELF